MSNKDILPSPCEEIMVLSEAVLTMVPKTDGSQTRVKTHTLRNLVAVVVALLSATRPGRLREAEEVTTRRHKTAIMVHHLLRPILFLHRLTMTLIYSVRPKTYRLRTRIPRRLLQSPSQKHQKWHHRADKQTPRRPQRKKDPLRVLNSVLLSKLSLRRHRLHPNPYRTSCRK